MLSWFAASEKGEVYLADQEGELRRRGTATWARPLGLSRYGGGLWMGAPDAIFASDGALRLWRFDGAWQPDSVAASGGIWGLAADDVFAVANNVSSPNHYDGSSWSSMVPKPPSPEHLSVWASSMQDLYIGSIDGVVYRFDGVDWATENIGGGPVVHLWGTAPGELFAVSTGGQIARRSSGMWSDTSTPTSEDMNGIWGAADDDVFAVGNEGTILHFDGTTWQAMESGTPSHLLAVWGTSGRDVFAVGAGPTVVHYDGQRWSPLRSDFPTGSSIVAVSGYANTVVLSSSEGELHQLSRRQSFTCEDANELDCDNGVDDDCDGLADARDDDCP